ncbi:TIGR02147 family protein [Bdellovibrio sp. HCB290]|uniref:TIGR02147 family protein n=1 Tax=Bdellovibrio sp. HCB290 TaxID=3394356 RepID=UPI0039B3C04A
MTNKPSLLDYIDYRLFLQAWYAYNKATKKGFSYGSWTQQCGFKSRSFIRLVMLGQRNLGEESIPQVAQSLRLNAAESEYFKHLVLYAHADSIQRKEFHFAKIINLNKGQVGSELRDIYKFLSNPKTPRVQLLLSLDSVICTLSYIAETMQISQGEALEILENIEACGLATFDETTDSWKSSISDLKIPTQIGNAAIRSFHLKSLKEAEEALPLPLTERSFNALLMTLNEEEFKELKVDLDQFQNFLSKKYKSQNLQESRIYQINLNLIPSSGKLNSKKLKEPAVQSNQKPNALEIPV